MPHEIIVGITESGKTTLAMQKALAYHNNGTQVIVLDPMRNPKWPGGLVFTDPSAFVKEVQAWRGCAIFVDEAGETVGRYDDELTFLATRGRHYGHNCYFIAQRAKMINTNVRNNCSILNMFKQSPEDCKELANVFAQEELKNGNKLSRGEFFYCNGFESVKKYKIF